MNYKNAIYLVFSLSILTTACFAQSNKSIRKSLSKEAFTYVDMEYDPSIKSIQFYPSGKENELPVYVLGSSDQLLLSFDDLNARSRNFYYSIELCDYDWKPNRLPAMDYAIGYNEDQIVDINSSQGTVIPYTHYSTSFPNEYVAPKLPGNYLLKVYEDGNKSKLMFSKRFYVVNSLVSIKGAIVASNKVEWRSSNQKLNIELKTDLTIHNPNRDLKLIILQNQRMDNAMVLSTASLFTPQGIKYHNPETLDFLANNEFRMLDLRSAKSSSAQIKDLIEHPLSATLFTDKDRYNLKYEDSYDENGKFYIRNLDYESENLNSEYIKTKFSLKTDQNIDGNIYIVGKFNNYQRTEANQLIYNASSQNWEVELLLKQGLYDYDYVLEKKNHEVSTDYFSGSHFATGNDYQVMVYYRRPGTYWDELIGFETISINNKSNKN